jgi:hypothetical protein
MATSTTPKLTGGIRKGPPGTARRVFLAVALAADLLAVRGCILYGKSWHTGGD